jgi:hypothetical protein
MAAGATYEPIATTTLGSTTATVTFTSISGSYTDLVIVINGQSGNGSASFLRTQFNNDSDSKYSTTRLFGDGSSPTSDRSSNQIGFTGGTLWGSQGVIIHQVLNYSNTTTFKNLLTRDNNAGNRVGAMVGLFRSIAAVTRIDFTCPDGGGFASGSTFTLYGIAAA